MSEDYSVLPARTSTLPFNGPGSPFQQGLIMQAEDGPMAQQGLAGSTLTEGMIRMPIRRKRLPSRRGTHGARKSETDSRTP
jgi:hypothetical protein